MGSVDLVWENQLLLCEQYSTSIAAHIVILTVLAM